MQTSIFTSSNLFIGLAPEMVGMIGIIILLLGFLFISSLLKRLQNRSRSEKARLDEKVNEARSQELEWYREKRFLMERQAREKQSRLEVLIKSVAPETSHGLTYPASRLFFLAESIREERQYLGTDISKLSLIDRRLRKLGKECIKQSGKGTQTEEWLSKMSMCRQMIQSNLEDLRKSQNLLRNVLGDVVMMEEKARVNEIADSDMPELLTRLDNAKDKLSELPDGLRTVAKSTGEQAQALFKESTRHIPDEVLHSVWKEQTTLDLFSSKHRPGGRSELLAAADGALSAFHSGSVHQDGFSAFQDIEPVVETPVEAEEIPDPVIEVVKEPEVSAHEKPTEGYLFDAPENQGMFEFSSKSEDSAGEGYQFQTDDEKTGEKPEEKEEPSDSVWATPLDFGLNAKKDEKFQFSPFKANGDKSKEDASSLVIFRSDNPEIWNTTLNSGEDNRAISLREISGEVEWLGIKRIDTGEEVFCGVDIEDLRSSGDGKSAGFNGTNEFFYGARHLGFFSEECATEVETLFTYGGWGFGHLATSEEDVAEQICGWNGQRIPNGTVFEFTLYEGKPTRVKDDQIIL